jgi:hypothetical protein
MDSILNKVASVSGSKLISGIKKENPADDAGPLDEGDDLHLTSTLGTGEWIESILTGRL